MPDFDIIGSNINGPYAGTPSSGFDVVAPNAGGRVVNGQAPNGAMPNMGQQQQQGAPVSGLLAGALGLPTYGGAVPGAAYLTSSQVQNAGGMPASVSPGRPASGLLAGLLNSAGGSSFLSQMATSNTGSQWV